MNFSTARSERITAMISTVVAVIILAGGVSAYQSHNTPVEDIVQLESDLRFQLEIAYRHNPNERAARLAQLEAVTQAWHASSREPAARKKLVRWLTDATIYSMPGSQRTLPPAPNFAETSIATTSAAPPSENLTRADNVDVLTSPVAAPQPTSVQPTPADDFSNEVLFDDEVDLPIDEATFDNDLANNKSVKPTSPVTEPIAAKTNVTATAVLVGAQPVVKTKPAGFAAPVRINLAELTARITGYHQGLREIEAQLLTLDTNNLETVARLVNELDAMTRDFQFVEIYYAALTDQERRAVSKPRSIAATLAELQRRLERNQSTSSGDFLSDFEANNQSPTTLLQQRLADIAKRVDW